MTQTWSSPSPVATQGRTISIATEELWEFCHDRESLSHQAPASSCPCAPSLVQDPGSAQDLDHAGDPDPNRAQDLGRAWDPDC